MSGKFYEMQFRRKLDAAMSRASEVLETSIRPVRCDLASHEYEDKFEVANCVTSLALEAVLALLEGELKVEDVAKKLDGSSKLKFESKETCVYAGEETREVKGPKVTVSQETKRPSLLGSGKSAREETMQTTVTVTEHAWTHSFDYSLRLVGARDEEVVATLVSRSRSHKLKTVAMEHAPKPAEKINQPISLSLKQLGDVLGKPIERDTAACKTPRRNEQVEDVLRVLHELAGWCRNVLRAFPNDDFSSDSSHDYFHQAVEGVFSPPAFACFVRDDENKVAVVNRAERLNLVREMKRSFEEQATIVVAATKKTELHLLDGEEARLCLALRVLQTLSSDYASAVGYLESMLRAQLEDAVGKELTAAGFAEYAAYHDRLLFSPDFEPRPFSFSVRRSAASFPDGEVRVDLDDQPVQTIVRCVPAGAMRFKIGGASSVTFRGDRYAHAYVARTFGNRKPPPPTLAARARQFSSFMLLVGKIVAPDEFSPSHAIILKNKDEIVIPLVLDPLPTPKEFADAIESLSPEQRAFCEAFRAMQLASSLFAILVVQLKPQVEAVLNLAPGALTKEIALTESLMQLFIEYSIPTDMLSYDGDADAPASVKIAAVKSHVEQIQAIIAKERENDLKATAQETLHASLATHRAQLGSKDSMEEDEECEDGVFGGLFGGVAAFECDSMDLNSIQPTAHVGAAPVATKGAMTFGASARSGGSRGSDQSMLMRSVATKAAAPRAAAMKMNKKSAAAPPPPVQMGVTLQSEVAQHQPPKPSRATAPPQPAEATEPQQPPRHQEQQAAPSASYDVTTLPKRLDANFKILDTDSQLRPTTIKLGSPWKRTANKSILAKSTTETLGESDLAKERARAFDLLDALTRSGGLDLTSTTLHVVVAITHSFDKSIVDTLVVDNVDPVLKAERASLIIASTLHDRPIASLVAPSRLPKVAAASPLLLPPPEDDVVEELRDEAIAADY